MTFAAESNVASALSAECTPNNTFHGFMDKQHISLARAHATETPAKVERSSEARRHRKGKPFLMSRSLFIGLACAMAVPAIGTNPPTTDPDPDPADVNATFGSVTGRVIDDLGQPLPGAVVYVEALQTGVVSDINGFYTLSRLRKGDYQLRVTYVGYQPVTYDVSITSTRPYEHDFTLAEGVQLQGVEVLGVFTGQRRALQLQKEQMGIANIVAADQVGKFPDSNIGDALKRINGVNVQYDQGEARAGQVRGTSADLTSVTVNGNRMPSAADDTRSVQLDLIPADMIQTIELNKVVTADMDGDAIGGAINLVTKNTPAERILNFNVGSGFSWVSEKPLWDLGVTWGDRFFDDKLGIMASISYQYNPLGSDNTEFEYEMNDDGEMELSNAQVRQYYVTRERQSYSLGLDYEFNPSHKISFKGLYNRRSDWEKRYRVNYKKLTSKPSKQSIVMETKAGKNRDARLELQQTLDLGLDGEHHFGALRMDWGVDYARAAEKKPDEIYASYTYEDEDYFSDLTFSGVNGKKPYAVQSLPDLSSDNWELDELSCSTSEVIENEWKAKLNFTLPLSTGLFGNSLKFGAKYTHKHKTNEVSYYDYDAEDVLGDDWRSLTTNEIRSGFMAGDNYQTNVPFLSAKKLGSLNFSQYDGEENLEEEAGNYDVKEQITAGYLRFDQSLGKKWDLTAGLRIEHTSLTTSGYTLDTEDGDALVPTGDYDHDYTNLLPSLLLKYKFNDDGNLRASVTKTLSRPKYSALIANKTYNTEDLEATIGDPSVEPATSWNFDLSADYYFKSIGLVSVGLFYKDIKNVNVEYLSYYTGEELGLSNYADETFEVEQNINAYDARIFGVEVAYQRDFGFIHPSLKCIGFYGNYTYTHSKARNFNERLAVDDSDDIKVAGSPEHTANASLYFEKWGLSMRLSYNFASSFIDEMSNDRALDRYYDRVHYLDLNAAYTWGKSTKYTVYANANNLLNQPLRYYQGDRDRTMQVEYYGVKLQAGIKVNL